MKVEQEFFIGVLDVDAEKRVKNTALLHILSDMSMYHGVVAGHTKPDRKSDISWIVLNWIMKVYRRPTMFSTVRAVTWARDYTRTRATRDYIIYDEEDNIVAEAISEWVAVDVSTGKFLRLNFLENKVKYFRELCPGAEIENFYTDSMNDEAMMDISEHVYLVKKDKITKLK